ncbi:MAG: hypothetical protein V3R42_02645 [candidate division NC10 bacterium]
MQTGMDIRKQIEMTMGERLLDKEWAVLWKQHGEPVQSVKLTISRLTEHAWDLVGLRPRPYIERPAEFLNIERGRVRDREAAMSILITQAAGRHPPVIKFRRDALKNRLLPLEEVGAWIKKQERRDGGPTRWVEIGLSPKEWVESSTKPYKITLQRMSGYSYHAKLLEYWTPGDQFVRRVAVASSRVLDKLREIGKILADRYRWWPAEATIFILTGSTPRCPSVRTTAHHATDQPLRIVLDIDAATTPRMVADAYRGARKAVFEGRKQRRPRALSEKHLQLAVFLGECPEGESWRDRRKAWNGMVKKAWRYRPEQIRNFQRDVRQASDRLLAAGTLEDVFS